MNLSYNSHTLEKQLTSQQAILKAFKHLGIKIAQRLNEIIIADNLRILKQFPSMNCRPLTESPNSLWVINVSGKCNIIFKINHSPLPTQQDGTIEYNAITDLCIIGIDN